MKSLQPWGKTRKWSPSLRNLSTLMTRMSTFPPWFPTFPSKDREKSLFFFLWPFSLLEPVSRSTLSDRYSKGLTQRPADSCSPAGFLGRGHIHRERGGEKDLSARLRKFKLTSSTFDAIWEKRSHFLVTDLTRSTLKQVLNREKRPFCEDPFRLANPSWHPSKLSVEKETF